MSSYEIIIDCTDNFEAKYTINDAAKHLLKPLVYSSIFQFSGQLTVFDKESACYRCLFPALPPKELAASCSEAGVLGVLPGIMGSLQASEAIKLALGQTHNMRNSLLMFDALTTSFKKISFKQSPLCPLCSGKKNFNTIATPTYACMDTIVPASAKFRLRQSRQMI
jgi:molybdopterin/thiamine biosynthesis adenylyltransferase